MLSYPLTLPTARRPASVAFSGNASVGMNVSPFTRASQKYVWQADYWSWDVTWGQMSRPAAEDLIGWLLGLNGREGTFLMGDPSAVTPRGTWAGTPRVNGANQQGRSLVVDGFAAGATGAAGDYFQLGSSSNSRLYKLAKAFTADGSGNATLDFWPQVRPTVNDNDFIISSNTVGIFQLSSNKMPWDVNNVIYGFSFQCEEYFSV